MTEPTTLYRAYGDGGALLYIGIAKNWGRRWAQHSERSPWFATVERVDLERHPTREAARAAERAAVQSEHPRHNIEHTPRDTRPMRRQSAKSGRVVRNFDHAALARTASYQAVGDAINALANDRALDGHVDSQEHLAAVVADIARHVPYGDCCTRCTRTTPTDSDEWLEACRPHHPVGATVVGDNLMAFYVCRRCGDSWSCGWGINAPALLA